MSSQVKFVCVHVLLNCEAYMGVHRAHLPKKKDRQRDRQKGGKIKGGAVVKGEDRRVTALSKQKSEAAQRPMNGENSLMCKPTPACMCVCGTG